MTMRSGDGDSLFREVAGHEPLVKVTVLYEDLLAGLRAKALMQSVRSRLAVPVRIRLECWRFDWLCERSLSSSALAAAANSAILLFSLSQPKALPTEVLTWVNRWTHCEGDRPAALVILLAPGIRRSAGTRRVMAPLQRAARQAGVDFFCEYGEPPDAAPSREPGVAGRGFLSGWRKDDDLRIQIPPSREPSANEPPTLRPDFGLTSSRRFR
jgi:hypothetical protein